MFHHATCNSEMSVVTILTMSALTIERDEQDIWHILRLSGYVDAHTFSTLEEVLSQEVETACDHLKIDCQQLKFIDSTGLGLLMAAYRQLSQHGGELMIENLNEKMSKIINLLGFDELTHQHQNELAHAMN